MRDGGIGREREGRVGDGERGKQEGEMGKWREVGEKRERDRDREWGQKVREIDGRRQRVR
jgi:hypothetical protein